MRPSFFLLIFISLLASCAAPLNVHQNSTASSQWLKQTNRLYQLNDWSLSGRVAIQTADNGGQADLIWRQAGNDFTIQLNGPLGSGALELTSLSDGVLLSSSSGEQLMAASAESLLQQIQGWQFPVSGLRYWLMGVPVPDKPYRLISWLDNGRLHVMQQDGWHIEFRQYQPVGNKMLPRKIFMHRLDDKDVDVRVVIRQWEIKNG